MPFPSGFVAIPGGGYGICCWQKFISPLRSPPLPSPLLPVCLTATLAMSKHLTNTNEQATTV